MKEYILVIPPLVSFLISLFFIPNWIKRARKAGFLGRDIHKFEKTFVAEGGGITVIAGFILGVLLFIALQTFYFHSVTDVIEIFALVSVILIISLIGLIDDLFGWKIGLGKKLRFFLVFLASIPLVVINAGESFVSIPFFGTVNLGLFYALVVIPVGVVGASTTFNFLAGFNGLEARQGILILSALAVASYFTGTAWLSVILLCMIASLSAFLFFNTNPAKVFPGDMTTYSIGALMAVTAILGDLERFAVFIFIPNIIEVFLKSRGKFKVESFGIPQKDGSVKLERKNAYSLTHVAIKILEKFKGKAYENDIVSLINIFQVLVILLGFIIFRKGIF